MPQDCDIDVICTAAGVRGQRGDHPGRVPSSGQHGAGARDGASRRPAARGDASIHSTGSSPGFISEAVPLVLTSIQRRLDQLRHRGVRRSVQPDSPDLLFDLMGFGSDPADFDHGRWPTGHSVSGRRCGWWPRRSRAAARLGGGQRRGGRGTRDDRDRRRHDRGGHGRRPADEGGRGLRRRAEAARQLQCHLVLHDRHRAGRGISARPAGGSRWPATPRWTSRCGSPSRSSDMAATTPGYTANRAVNAVPVVCGRLTGIRTTVDLPQVIANLGDPGW